MKRSQLRPDPERVRDWMRRTRATQRQRERENARKPIDWQATNPPFRAGSLPGLRGFTQRVFTLYGRRCVVCGARAREGHHTIPVRTILCRGDEDAKTLACDARNGTPVCRPCHANHESAHRRIRRCELPAGVIEWVQENDFGWYLKRIYPAC